MVLSILFAGIVLPGATAQSCTCIDGDSQKSYKMADSVFFGEIVDKEPLGSEKKHGVRLVGPPVAKYTVEVEQVYKGEVHARQVFYAGGSEISCGRTFPASGGVLIYGAGASDKGKARDSDAPASYGTGLCSGSYTTDVAPTSLGEGQPPIGAVPALTGQLTVEPEETSNTGTWVAVAGGLVVLVAAGLGVVIWRRRPS
jgi:hypothetical protein